MKPSPLKRYFTDVITRGGRDLRFSSSLSGSRSPPTGDRNASRRPSGASCGSVTSCTRVRSAGIMPRRPAVMVCRCCPRGARESRNDRMRTRMTDHGGALEGVVVIEVAQTLAGELAGGLLADLGATVIKIEPPEGSPLRKRGPAIAGEDSLYFQSENRGKL